MRSIYKAVAERLAVAVIGGLVSGWVTLLGWSIFGNSDEVPWALTIRVVAIGGTAGLIWGNRSITGRPANCITGLLLGCLFGAISGWCWSWCEYAVDVRQLTAAGIPKEFVTSSKGGTFMGHYQRTALRSTVISGICVGAVAGYLRGANQQFDRIAWALITAALIVVLFSICAAFREFSDLSAKNHARIQADWNHSQSSEFWKRRLDSRRKTWKD